MQLELFNKEDWQILLEAEEYFKYLQKPNDAFYACLSVLKS